MGGTILWVLLTGLTSGAIWVGIVLMSRQRRLAADQASLIEELHRRMDQLEQVEKRLAELEDRSDFAERVLTRRRSTPQEQLRPLGVAG